MVSPPGRFLVRVPNRRSPTEIVQPPPRRPGGAVSGPSDNNLRSPMAGRVIAIMVRPGDQVSVGR